MTDLQSARLALRLILKNENSTPRILVLARYGLGEFTFSETMREYPATK